MQGKGWKWRFKSPRRLLGVVYHLATQLNRKYYKHRNHRGYDISEGDWDNLLILDGCRYDLYRETIKGMTDLDGELKGVRAAGSSSSEFFSSNFVNLGNEFHDTVYITANASIQNHSDDVFYAKHDLLTDGWDDEYETVLPDTVVKSTLNGHRRYPHKRIIAHFMQPHYPFLGETGEKIEHSGIRKLDENGEPVGKLERSVWSLLKHGEISRELVWNAYRENLEIVLDSVKELLRGLDGKTVITSDHGNLVGDWIGPIPTRGFGHPSHLHTEKLIRVPWHIVTRGNRREVIKESPISTESPSESVVKHRLRELGYMN